MVGSFLWCALLVCVGVARASYNVSFPPHQASDYPAGVQVWDKLTGVIRGVDAHYFSHLPEGGVALQPQRIKLHMKMNDGKTLATSIVNPWPYNTKKGTVVCRSPYGPTSDGLAKFLVKAGFAAVMQDGRGTFSSGGIYDMWRTSNQDGLTMLEWIVAQKWSNGKVFSVGVSADGINELTMIELGPSMLRGQWFMWTTPNGHHTVYPGGAYRQSAMEGYMNLMALPTRMASSTRVIPEMRHNEAWSNWWVNLTDALNTSEPPIDAYKHVHWPIILTVGWWDLFEQQQLDAWTNLRKSSPSAYKKSLLVVGPLGHCFPALQVGALGRKLHLAEQTSMKVSMELAKELFEENYAGPVRARVGHVNLFVQAGFDGGVTGNYWTSLADWPTPTTHDLYLNSGATLDSAPAKVTGHATYTYDPATPTPMLGGNNLPTADSTPGCSTMDQLPRESRKDLAVFDSEPLRKDLAVVGRITAQLFVSSSANDTDFIVHVSDLSPGKTKSMLVRFGARRMRWREAVEGHELPSVGLEAHKIYAIDVDLSSTAYIFPKGHSVRIAVSSAAAPYFSPNHNTGHNHLVESDKMVKAQNRIHFSPQYPSRISLPTVPLAAIPENPHFSRATEAASIVV